MSKDIPLTKDEGEKGEVVTGKPPVKSSKKEETPMLTTRFIGFHRHSGGGPWTMLPHMLSSESSVKHKIELFKGECEMHIIEVDLPI